MDLTYSVLLPVYCKDDPVFLRQSIDSMLKQTKKPEEMLIVFDGQVSAELDATITEYVEKNPGLFTILRLDVNRGLGIALREGISACRNELIARMDADDISLPTRCARQLDLFEKDPSLDIVGTWIDEFYDLPEMTIATRAVPLYQRQIEKFSRRRSPFNHPSVMYRKTSVLSAGNYSNMRRQQDHELFVRMLLNGSRAVNIGESLLLFRGNRNNVLRKKQYSTCKSYIKLVFGFWKIGHSSFCDLLIVAAYQIILFASPVWLARFLSGRVMRNKIVGTDVGNN